MGALARLSSTLGPSPHLQWGKTMTASSQHQWENPGDGKLKPTGARWWEIGWEHPRGLPHDMGFGAKRLAPQPIFNVIYTRISHRKSTRACYRKFLRATYRKPKRIARRGFSWETDEDFLPQTHKGFSEKKDLIFL
jgi:hypothetical protein